jgi:hypothetical protein
MKLKAAPEHPLSVPLFHPPIRCEDGFAEGNTGPLIGSEVTAESSPTKYRLSWDSHSVANGDYTLTAVARDATGNTTTSAGVAVTISN